MVDEITNPLSAATPSPAFAPNGNGSAHDLSSARSAHRHDVGQPSEGIGRAITAIAVGPLLKIFRLLSRLASRSLFTSEAERGAHMTVQDAAIPGSSTHTVRDGPVSAEERASVIPSVTSGVRGDVRSASGPITFDASFDGTEPSGPKPAGNSRSVRRSVT